MRRGHGDSKTLKRTPSKRTRYSADVASQRYPSGVWAMLAIPLTGSRIVDAPRLPDVLRDALLRIECLCRCRPHRDDEEERGSKQTGSVAHGSPAGGR